MKKLIFVFYFLTIHLNSQEFTVASYNVENLFDLKYDGTEYKQFQPNTKSWNKKLLNIKLKKISKTIKDLDADILALQEIESQKAFDLLLAQNPQYSYGYFMKNIQASVGLGILSKYKIINNKTIKINDFDKYSRPILSTTIKIKNKKFIIYNNHWQSKRAGESKRTRYAIALKNQIESHSNDTDYILIGDFNSNYNEWKTFKYEKRLNNTYGITGINHILNTIIDNTPILQSNINKFKKRVHYNLWYELTNENRFSYKFRGDKNTPDNILLPKALFDTSNISYVRNSFKVFKPKYLYKDNKINRWNKSKGYSDHLPIIATFTTNTLLSQKEIKTYKLNSYMINHLYTLEFVDKPIKIKDTVVIYKFKKNAIVKQPNNRAIYLYGCATDLEIGMKYDLTIDTIANHFGLLEVKEISKVKKKASFENYEELHQDGNKIDIFDEKYTNEIVTNLKGRYKRGYLYLENNQRIKLYFPKRVKKPKNNSKIEVKKGHLGIYKSNVQILIHRKSDIKRL